LEHVGVKGKSLAKNIITLALNSSYDDPDWSLIRAVAEQDMEALNELYLRYGTTVLVYLTSHLADRELAEEVLQDVMLAVWKGAARFRFNSSVKTWLLAIARYQAINARRRRKLPALSLDEDWTGGQDEPEQLAEQQLIGNELAAALLQLPAEQRETLQLLFYQDLSPTEVAQVMKVAPGTVKSRLSRARTALRKLLKMPTSVEEGNAR
jgi:RNA polymerase sigma-70 factor, ECF subfamily